MKILRISLGSILIIFMMTCVGMAAGIDASGSLLLDADYAVFRAPTNMAKSGDTSQSYVEIFYTIHRSQLKYQPADTGYVANIDFKLILSDENGKQIDSSTWRAVSRIEKLSALEDQNYLISDIVADMMPVGHFIVNLYIFNDGHDGRASFRMDVPDLNKKELGLSSLELAYEIKPDSTGKFIKAGYRVMPNPSRQFLKENNVVYIYAEGYGLDQSPQSDTGYSVILNFINSNGDLIHSLPATIHRKPGESTVIITGFPIATFKAGQYSLKMDFIDGDRKASNVKDFTVLATPMAARQAYMQTLLADFPEADRITTEKEADAFRNDIIYIATPDELRLYDSLNLTGKANFQKKFWDDRNPDPSSPINQYKLEHYRRLKYVDAAWGRFQGKDPGWKTDRGRVYVLYGEPDQIERTPSSLETRSWERWWYNGLEGGVYFVFVDFETSEDYKLVHSTKKNEISNPDWQNMIDMSANQR